VIHDEEEDAIRFAGITKGTGFFESGMVTDGFRNSKSVIRDKEGTGFEKSNSGFRE
jgi:hypothetical protein